MCPNFSTLANLIALKVLLVEFRELLGIVFVHSLQGFSSAILSVSTLEGFIDIGTDKLFDSARHDVERKRLGQENSSL